MPFGLDDALTGWLVSGAGTWGVRRFDRLVFGDETERALRRVVKQAIGRAAEIAPDGERDRLRSVLIEHQAEIAPQAASSLHTLLWRWIEPLARPPEGIGGPSYLDSHQIASGHLLDVLEREIRDGIRAGAAHGGALKPIDDQLGRAEIADEMRAGFRQVEAALGGPPPAAAPRQLPPDLADFTGRGHELDRLEDQVGGQPNALLISAVAGKPGVGKSALAVHLAHRIAARYPDAHLYAALRGADAVPVDPHDVLGGFLHALGMPQAAIPASLADRAAAYRSALSHKRALVILDNAAGESQVRPLLPGTPSCLVVVTSRRDLAIEGAQNLVLDTLSGDEGIDLMHRVAGTRVAAEPEAARQVVRLCGELPLAIRIAAARLRSRSHWSVAYLAERLSGEHRRLDALKLGDLDVRATFDVSYRELSPGQAALFRRFGVLPGAEFDAGLATFTAAGAVAPEAIGPLLEDLADMHLVEAAAPGHYRLHDLLRLFARERLEAEEGADGIARAVRAIGHWYVETGDTINEGERENDHPEQKASRLQAWQVAERANALAVAEAATAAGELDTAVEIYQVMNFDVIPQEHEWAAEYGFRRLSPGSENLDALERLRQQLFGTSEQHGYNPKRALWTATKRARTGAGPDEQGLRALRNDWSATPELENLKNTYFTTETAVWLVGDAGDARREAEQALALYRRTKDTTAEGRCLYLLAQCRGAQGDPGAAVALFNQAYRLLWPVDPVTTWQIETLRRLARDDIRQAARQVNRRDRRRG